MALESFAFEQLTVSDPATVATSAIYSPVESKAADEAFVQVVSGSIRYRIDGGTAAQGVGHLLETGDGVTLETGHDVGALSMIRVGNSNAIVAITYRR